MSIWRKKPNPQTFDGDTVGALVGDVASQQLGMGRDAKKVAMAAGVNSAVTYIRHSKAGKKAKRAQQKAARRRNR